jgi:hypothetical protein
VLTPSMGSGHQGQRAMSVLIHQQLRPVEEEALQLEGEASGLQAVSWLEEGLASSAD